ncbi:hypothetical protein E2C01_051361 [Portunus trituberculatus]|uniref:Reverse transcriptase RNase H-like domain-containing protein n=1 Tax=Portunus trituberculatus TaxID=210409 RepID=A0A5B7GEJ0_PORTR|nr:hypothetical protein [Portunus trituberculatus]
MMGHSQFKSLSITPQQLSAPPRIVNHITGGGMKLLGSLTSCLFLLSWKNLTIIMDYKTLMKIFRDKELKDINKHCILNLKEKMLMYNFCIRNVKWAHQKSDDAVDKPVCTPMVAVAADDGGRTVELREVEEDALKDKIINTKSLRFNRLTRQFDIHISRATHPVKSAPSPNSMSACQEEVSVNRHYPVPRLPLIGEIPYSKQF